MFGHNFRSHFLFKNQKGGKYGWKCRLESCQGLWILCQEDKSSTAMLHITLDAVVDDDMLRYQGMLISEVVGKMPSFLDSVLLFHYIFLNSHGSSLCGRPFNSFIHITSKPMLILICEHLLTESIELKLVPWHYKVNSCLQRSYFWWKVLS